MKNHAKRGVKRHNSPAPPFQDPPKEDFVWQGTSSPGVGVLRFNGAAWETGWHFCPRDSLNVIINQPTSLFFEAAMGSLWASREDTVMGCNTVLPPYFIFSLYTIYVRLIWQVQHRGFPCLEGRDVKVGTAKTD